MDLWMNEWISPVETDVLEHPMEIDIAEIQSTKRKRVKETTKSARVSEPPTKKLHTLNAKQGTKKTTSPPPPKHRRPPVKRIKPNANQYAALSAPSSPPPLPSFHLSPPPSPLPTRNTSKRKDVMEITEAASNSHNLLECERKMVKDLCLEWSIDEPRAQILLDVTSRGLVYSVSRHFLFGDFVQSAWDATGLPRLTREGGSHRGITFTSSATSEKRLYRGKRTDLVELVQVEQDGGHQRLRLTRPEYECLMSSLLCGAWRDTVRRLDMIPTALSRALYIVRLDFRGIFRGLTGVPDADLMPWWASLSLNPQRVQQNRLLLLTHSEPEDSSSAARHPGEPLSFSEQVAALLKESRETEQEDSQDRATVSAVGSLSEELCFGGADGYTMALLPAEERVVGKSHTLAVYHSERNGDYWRWKPVYRQMSIHPYALSSLTFCLSVHLSKTMASTTWTPARIYHFLRGWLANDEPVVESPVQDIPVELGNAANLLVSVLSSGDMSVARTGMAYDPALCDDLRQMVELVQNAHTLLDMHRARRRGKGRFHKFRLADTETTQRVAQQYFLRTSSLHSTAPPPTPSPNSLEPCPPPCGPTMADLKQYRLLLFDRQEVDPLDLKRSVEIVEKWFFRTVDAAVRAAEQSETTVLQSWEEKWVILFDDKHTMLLGEKHRLFAMLRYYNAYLPTSCVNFRREIEYPLYAYHVHAFFYGDRRGVLTCMKFLLKSFCRLKYDVSGLREERVMLPEPEDPVIQMYGLLANIISRFGSTGAIWHELVRPLNNTEFLRFAPLRVATSLGKPLRKGVPLCIADQAPRQETDVVYGIKDECRTLYHALRAFVLVYCPHTLSYRGLRTMYRLFMRTDTSLQHRVPLAWKLLQHLYEQAEEAGTVDSPDYSCEIPEKFFAPHEFPFPTHLVFYHLCATRLVDDETALDIFLSIGCTTSRRLRDLQFPLYFTSPPPPQPSSPSSEPTASEVPNKKLAGMYGRLHDVRRDIYQWYKEQMKRDDIQEPPAHAESLAFLLQSLEELSYYSVRFTRRQIAESHPEYRGVAVPGAVPELHSNAILADHKMPPRYPVDYDASRKEVLYCENVFPVWPSGFFGYGEEAETEESVQVPRFGTEPRPFLGCHKDMLPCIVLSPVRVVHTFDTTDDEFIERSFSERSLEQPKIPLDPRHYFLMNKAVSSSSFSPQSPSPSRIFPASSPSEYNSNVEYSPRASPSPSIHDDPRQQEVMDSPSISHHPSFQRMRKAFCDVLQKQRWNLRPGEALSMDDVITRAWRSPQYGV